MGKLDDYICPRCYRHSVEYDPFRRLYRCLFRDCSWSEAVGGKPLPDYYFDLPQPWAVEPTRPRGNT